MILNVDKLISSLYNVTSATLGHKRDIFDNYNFNGCGVKMLVIHITKLFDDLLATGGTAAAAASLITDLGANVAGFCFIVVLDALSGEKKIIKYSDKIMSLINY